MTVFQEVFPRGRHRFKRLVSFEFCSKRKTIYSFSLNILSHPQRLQNSSFDPSISLGTTYLEMSIRGRKKHNLFTYYPTLKPTFDIAENSKSFKT